MEETSETFRSLLARYRRNGHAINVDFRSLVNSPSKVERATHLLHTYPAKILPHIPFFFLANSILSQRGDTVLDPFVGSGTVVLESLLSGRNAVGADSNPFAQLLSRVKTTPIALERLLSASKRLLSRIPEANTECDAEVVNIEHWFYPATVRKLSKIRNAISVTQDEAIREFFLVCFSTAMRKASLADPRLSVPVRLREGQYPPGHPLREKSDQVLRKLRKFDVIAIFEKILMQNISRLQRIDSIAPQLKLNLVSNDARVLKNSETRRLNRNSVDLVITSPPYPGAQKYVRACCLSLGWLGLSGTSDLLSLKRAAIGREEFRKHELEHHHETMLSSANSKLCKIASKDPVRAAIAGAYINEMEIVLHELERVLRPGGYMVIVIANGTIGGESFYTERYIRQLAEQVGFQTRLRLIDEIRSRGLMTKRNKTANIITREFVIVFEKPL
jgi:hypothetical protein